MMFWDSSAILPLLLREARSPILRTLRDEDPESVVWCLTDVETWSAIARRRRSIEWGSPEIVANAA